MQYYYCIRLGLHSSLDLFQKPVHDTIVLGITNKAYLLYSHHDRTPNNDRPQ